MTLFSQLVVIPKLDPSVRTMLISGAVLLVIPFVCSCYQCRNLTGRQHGDFWFWLWSYQDGTAAELMVVNPEEQGLLQG